MNHHQMPHREHLRHRCVDPRPALPLNLNLNLNPLLLRHQEVHHARLPRTAGRPHPLVHHDRWHPAVHRACYHRYCAKS